ncbi:hypothetical protein CPAR01_16222 [Colletotrichum paranaense]|uniref:Uncharacterized protein n=1 Tax=Colletotrichum paranaense TaxID=1914294 RepID=A0ABQ9RWZ8_9PEZI|nr:uncharacterized protein CPAR01_16222 [Colletotrichum paranaense]KAK1517358.1 hypothetical protein CPAR01_16222 [Colletotrichum paranaense]
MAIPFLAGMMIDRAIDQGRQPSEDRRVNLQRTLYRRDQLANPQYNSQMALDTLSTSPLGKVEQSTWIESCDLSARLSALTAFLRSLRLQCPRLSCLADSGISSLKKTRIVGHVSTSPETSAVTSSSQASGLSPSMRARPSVRKARLSKRSTCNEDGSDDDDEEPRASTKKRAKFESTKLQFACPFWKLDPSKHRSCYSATLSETRYVKQHILRRHVQPPHFHKSQTPCMPDGSPRPELEGIDSAQERVLLSWRAKRGSSKEEQWFELWKMIFPYLPTPSSPFMDEEVIAQPQPEHISAQLNAPRFNKRFNLSLNERNVAKNICVIREESPEIEWLNKNQKQRLQQRSMKTNEAEKWREMYSTLFPGAREISSPYHEEPESHAKRKDPAVERYSEFLDRELPQAVRRELDKMGFLGDEMTSQLVGIVREAQASLSRQYEFSMLFDSNEESKKTESVENTLLERFHSPNLTPNVQTQPYNGDVFSTAAYDGPKSSDTTLSKCQSDVYPPKNTFSAAQSEQDLFEWATFDPASFGPDPYLDPVIEDFPF